MWRVINSICSLADGFTRFSVLRIIHENCYDEQSAKLITGVKYSIDAYHGSILVRYILPIRFGNFNSRDYHGGSLNVMFPGFLTVSYHFSWYISACFLLCFYDFLQCFFCFPSLFSLFPFLDFANKLVLIYSKVWNK